MPARFTPLITDYYYHVFNRGVNRQPIFEGIRSYKRFTNIIRFYNFVDYPLRFSKFLLLSTDQRREIWNRLAGTKTYVDIISYCLMPNHFHMLLKQNESGGISKFISIIQNSYTKYINIKNDRVGHLFQGQFKAVKIDSGEQLLHVSRYIHLNPYSSALVAGSNSLLNYEWSSFKEFVSIQPYGICKKGIILNSFKSSDEYRNFVLDNADYQKNMEAIKHLTIDI